MADTRWYESHILSVVQASSLDRTFALETPAPAFESFVPGQFLVVRDPSLDATTQRAYSLSSAPGERLQLTVRDMGSFGHTFYEFAAGKVLNIRAPQGKFVLDSASTDPLLLVAGGSGVTPFRSFVRHLRSQTTTRPTVLVQSARQPDQLVFHAEFADHAQACEWFEYIPTVTRTVEDDPWSGRRGRVDISLLRALAKTPQKTTLYACGPGAFVRAILSLASDVGVPQERLRKEQWG